MVHKRYIFALTLAIIAQTATAQDNTAHTHLAACQAVHNMPRTLSRLRDTRMSASQASFDTDAAHLRRQVQVLEGFSRASPSAGIDIDAETQTLSRTLANLNLRLSESLLTRPPFAKAIPENFRQSLSTLSLAWNCDQFSSDLSLPIDAVAQGGPAFDTTRSAAANAAEENAPSPAYEHIENRGMSSNARSQYLAQNSVKIFFENNRQYLIFFIILIAIGTTRYVLHRIKKFEAREARKILNRLIKVRLDNQIHDFYLVDLSRNGAKLNHPRAILNSGSVEIRLGDAWHLGQIKWHNEFFAGVLFKTPLDIETFSDMTPAA